MAYTNVENAFAMHVEDVINETINDEYQHIADGVLRRNDMMKSIVLNYIDSLQYVEEWNITETKSNIIIEEPDTTRTFRTYEEAYEFYKDGIVEEIQCGLCDSEGYYNFYLDKEQILFMGLEDEYNRQCIGMKEGTRDESSYETLDEESSDIKTKNETSSDIKLNTSSENKSKFIPKKQPKNYIKNLDELAEIIDKQLDILDIAREVGFDYVKNGKESFKTTEHDSLILSTKYNKFFWNSTGKKGGPISLYMLFKDVSFTEAVKTLSKRVDLENPGKYFSDELLNEVTPIDRHKNLALQLIELNYDTEDNKKMIQARAYLTKTRMIDKEIVDKLINDKVILQISDDKGRRQIAFIGRNEDGLISGVCQRTTSSTSKFKGDFSGCDYERGWFYDPQFNLDQRLYDKSAFPNPNKTLLCFESTIEMMSYMSILKLTGRNYNNYAYLSCGSISKAQCILETCKLYGYKKAYVMFNNDFEKGENNPGKNAAKREAEKLIKNGIDGKMLIPNSANDWNDTLIAYRNNEIHLSTTKKTASIPDKLKTIKNNGTPALSQMSVERVNGDRTRTK